jgi:hypothetical protein
MKHTELSVASVTELHRGSKPERTTEVNKIDSKYLKNILLS